MFGTHADSAVSSCRASALALCLAALPFACSGQQTPAHEPANTAASEPPAPAGTVAPADEPAAAESAAASPPAPAPTPAPPPESLFALCNKMCDAVAPKCTAIQLEGCRSTCKNYEAAPEACDGTVRTALECARSDRDFLFCSNVIPLNCAKQFKNVGACVATGVPPVEPVKKAIPDGWERFEAKGLGFSVVMPKGVSEEPDTGVRRWSAATPNGAKYEVALHPAPAEKKFDNKAFLRISRNLFGRCADKMKLHAIVEKPTETSIQFKTSCPENTEQVGRMHVIGSSLYVLTLKFPTGVSVEVDPFVYSFETRK
jgi:hypothetical protein